MSKIYGNATGGFGFPKTYILTDEDGNEFTGVVTDQEKVFDATVADVIVGKTFASDEGVQIGEDTRIYRVRFSDYLIFPNEKFSIPIEKYDAYDYTDFHAMISVYNTNKFDSTSVEKIVIFDSVYNAGMSNKLSDITKNIDTKSIDFNIVNNTDNTYIVHYSTYREEY